jgi:hypothetical protein
MAGEASGVTAIEHSTYRVQMSGMPEASRLPQAIGPELAKPAMANRTVGKTNRT